MGDYAGVHLVNGDYHFIDRQGRFIEDKTYKQISSAYYNKEYGTIFGVMDKEGMVSYLDKTLTPVLWIKNGAVDGAVYYQDERIDGLSPDYSDILYCEWPIVIARHNNSDNSSTYLLNRETGVGRKLSTAYHQVRRVGDYFVGEYNQEYTVFDINGVHLTDTVFQRYSSISFDISSDIPYFWVTTARYQGYTDLFGQWLYRESRFNRLDD